MLRPFVQHFLNYCKVVNFSDRSQQSLSIRLNEFNRFVKTETFSTVADLTYAHLILFITEFGAPSVHMIKSRIWTLKQFFHFLMLNGHIEFNPTLDLPYPKMPKTAPSFLTLREFKKILRYFLGRAGSFIGLRDVVIVLMLGILGIRTRALIQLDLTDFNIEDGTVWVKEKGGKKRHLVMPDVLTELIQRYFMQHDKAAGPLFLSKRGRRISQRVLQDTFKMAALECGIEKSLHARLFRHTAATYLTQIAGVDIAQEAMGHARRSNTLRYSHLNPNNYVVYMQRHPFMQLAEGGDLWTH